MREKRLAILAVCCLLLTVGCKSTQRILVQPNLGAYQYARVGDDLVFSAYFPSKVPIYVIFSGDGPCGTDVPYVTVPAGQTGSCKITSEANTYYFYPSFNPPPPTPPGQHFIGPLQIPQPCPQCQEIIIDPKGGTDNLTGTDQSKLTPSSGSGTATPITVHCSDGNATVDEFDDLLPGQQVFWAFSPDRTVGLTITLPAGVCQKTTFQQGEPCTLQPQQSYPNKVTYSVVVLNKCATSSATLTIKAPPQSTQTPQPPQ